MNNGEYVEPQCTQLTLLRESLQALQKKRDLARSIRKSNLKAAERSGQAGEKNHVHEHYLHEVAGIEAAIRRTELKIKEFQEKNPCKEPERLRSREYGPILVVDDEKNIRLTLSQSLESLGVEIRTAVNGEEALRKLKEEDFSLILLDLRMPGMDGMEVLRRVRQYWSKPRVIIITAHGTIESAVEAMKLGAADFIQKPFSPREIRDLVTQVLDREELTEETAEDYQTWISLSKRYIADRKFEDAHRAIGKAMAIDPGQPEPYNLTGVLFEIKGEMDEARRFFRAALDIDPAYKPATANLSRTPSVEQIQEKGKG
ncbi:MAG: response regulator [Desulfobacteraceae bacterium]|nr:MAG: response regulator [Desulfobacteraceae bacterium]